jgi:hypothetical protein
VRAGTQKAISYQFDKLVWNIIARGLSPNPHFRFQRAQSLMADLRHVKANLQTDLQEPPAPKRGK